MADTTAIEWTDATWNPVTGCTKISAGCDHCYAERFSERFRGVKGHPFEQGFDLTFRPDRLEQPLRWREPRMIFVNSMSDLFHKQIPKEFVSRVCDTMEKAHWHTFQVLTKRSSVMRDFLRRRYGMERGRPTFGSVYPLRTAPRNRGFGTSKKPLPAFAFSQLSPLSDPWERLI
jgi:Bacteriophage protein gp37